MLSSPQRLPLILLPLVCLFLVVAPAFAQDTVTGAFEGTVTNSQTNEAIKDAEVEIKNEATGLVIRLRTDSDGRFYEGQLAPGMYRITVTVAGFKPREIFQELRISYTDQ